MLLNDEETRKDKSLILDDIKTNKQTYYFVLIVLGLLNNLGYVLVNSSAQQLGRQFHQEKLMSLFTFCLTFLGVVTSLANSKYLLKIRHYTKIKITVLSFCTAYVLVGISNTISNIFGFFLCLIGSIIMGISTTLGSQTILGFLKGFDPDLLSGWGCGTGFAGVFGAGINFLLRFIHIPGYMIFLGMLPTNLVYLLCFKWLKDQKVSQIDRNEQEFNRPLRNLGKGTDLNEGSSVAMEEKDQQEADINQALTIENLKRVWPKTWTYTLNQSSVYFLEYTIITVFADKATTQYRNSDASIELYAFIFLNFCYQVGVVISRSSLAWFKIRRVGVISILQLINFGLWAWIAYEKVLSLSLILVLMIYVGLMGGASYINTLYLAMESEDLKKKDKEIAVNILNTFDNVGIILATLLSLLLANTVYANK